MRLGLSRPCRPGKLSSPPMGCATSVPASSSQREAASAAALAACSPSVVVSREAPGAGGAGAGWLLGWDGCPDVSCALGRPCCSVAAAGTCTCGGGRTIGTGLDAGACEAIGGAGARCSGGEACGWQTGCGRATVAWDGSEIKGACGRACATGGLELGTWGSLGARHISVCTAAAACAIGVCTEAGGCTDVAVVEVVVVAEPWGVARGASLA